MNWNEFEITQYVKAPKEKVFRAWTVPTEMEKWFSLKTERRMGEKNVGGSNDSFKEGETIYNLHGENDCSFTKVILVVPNETVRFLFESETVVVDLKFTEDGDFTKVVLKQSNMPDTEKAKSSWHLSCKIGWTNFMHNLKAVVQHGVDLRERDLAKDFFYNCE